jgi:SAM-dependent methyltransferase
MGDAEFGVSSGTAQAHFGAKLIMEQQRVETGDRRTEVYDHLHRTQLEGDSPRTRYAAERILGIVARHAAISAVLDVGCGLGDWLAAAAARGITRFRGLEGPWLDPSRLHIDPARVEIVDLEKDFSVNEQFDLVISLEVAEHLSADAADRFIANLTRHAPLVLFSAAIPFQGGHHHVNEQFLPYWLERFSRQGFGAIDAIRADIWDDARIPVWLRQNIMLFARDDVLNSNAALRALAENHKPLSIVHPDYWEARSKLLSESRRELGSLLDCLRRGGLVKAEVDAKGVLQISNVVSPDGASG